jgi:hypothetical protein
VTNSHQASGGADGDGFIRSGANDWRSVRSGAVDPGRLVIGDGYRLLITTTYVTGTSALVSGSADYDNVALRAGDEEAGKGGKGKGSRGGDGSDDSSRSLLDLLRRGKPATLRRTVNVGKGKRKLVALRVKPKAKRKVAKRKRLLVRQRVRVGKRSATLLKSRRLIRR